MRTGRRLPRNRRRLLDRHVHHSRPQSRPARRLTPPRKSNTKSILGPAGLRHILASLPSSPGAPPVKTVCIGGVNADNLQRVIYQSAAEVPGVEGRRPVNGVAIVSAIVGAEDPEVASFGLKQLLESPPAFVARGAGLRGSGVESVDDVLARVRDVVSAVDSKKPLSHNMTNLVRIL